MCPQMICTRFINFCEITFIDMAMVWQLVLTHIVKQQVVNVYMLVVCGTIINQTSQHTLYSTNTEEIYYQSTTIPIMNNFELIHMSAVVYQSVLRNAQK